MIRVRIERRPTGGVSSLSCTGHAGFDDGNGLDLVCAAVSALTGLLGIAFTETLPGVADLSVADGLFTAALRPDLKENRLAPAQAVIDSVARALEQMAEHYSGFLALDER